MDSFGAHFMRQTVCCLLLFASVVSMDIRCALYTIYNLIIIKCVLQSTFALGHWLLGVEIGVAA